MKKGVIRTTIMLDTDTLALIDRICKEEHRTLNSVIRIALIHFAQSRKESVSGAHQAA